MKTANKQQILDRLNEIIEDEKGVAITMNSMFMDSDLDSLGVMLTIVTLDTDFPFIPEEVPGESDVWQQLDIANLTVRELIRKCKLSTTNTSTEQ